MATKLVAISMYIGSVHNKHVAFVNLPVDHDGKVRITEDQLVQLFPQFKATLLGHTYCVG